jgi:urease accessory protein
MVREGQQARDGRPVLGLTRDDPAAVQALLDWVAGQLSVFRGGGLVPVDPASGGPRR